MNSTFCSKKIIKPFKKRGMFLQQPIRQVAPRTSIINYIAKDMNYGEWEWRYIGVHPYADTIKNLAVREKQVNFKFEFDRADKVFDYRTVHMRACKFDHVIEKRRLRYRMLIGVERQLRIIFWAWCECEVTRHEFSGDVL